MRLSVFGPEYFMRQAYLEAQKAYDDEEVPVGAVITCDNKIIARSHNSTERLKDVTAHAEILAITAACSYLQNKYLKGCTLYVTLEPCVMCAGALRWSQPEKVVYAVADPKAGFMRYGKDLLHPKTQLQYGLMEKECQELLLRFFKSKR